MNKLQQLIIESVNEYMKAIEAAGEMAGHKSKMEAAKEAIEKRDITKTLDKLDEAEKMMIDEKKVKEMANERKALEKYLAKLQKQLDKLESKLDKAPKVEEEEEKEIVDETMMDENDPENGPQLEEEYDTNIYEMLHMQKLAGVISESEYKVKVEEAKKKTTADLTKKEKSKVVKKSPAGKDINKKTKSLKEEVLALFENENLQPIKSILLTNISPEEKMDKIGTYLTDTEDGLDLSNTNLGDIVDKWFNTKKDASKWLNQVQRLINNPEELKNVEDNL
jgi:hypothetical protein